VPADQTWLGACARGPLLRGLSLLNFSASWRFSFSSSHVVVVSIVCAWLGRHPRFVFHFTPTSANWLNEDFFAKLNNGSSSVASSDRS
jgi:hypothetical protein